METEFPTAGYLFSGLYLLDGLLTKIALGLGAMELNPVIRYFGEGNVLITKAISLVAIVALALHALPTLPRVVVGFFRVTWVAYLALCLWNTLMISLVLL